MTRELFTLTPRATALTRLLDALPTAPLSTENLPLEAALHRILAEPVVATHPLPQFARSTVDGYAVRAADTFGATESLPAYLNIIGEILMGRPSTLALGPGQAALIHTGGALPDGADAVVMVEQTQDGGPGLVEILKAAAPGGGVIPVGEDVRTGDLVIPAGRRLRAQELGGLAALGLTQIPVIRRPRVALISTGDELVTPETTPGPNQVRDINTIAIGALVESHGGLPLRHGIIPDDPAALERVAQAALADADILIITAGSSVSARDKTSEVINRLGTPGVLVHGIPLRPGKPTILAVCDGKPVFGLPGNPVSALNSARLFIPPVLDRLQGAEPPRTPTLRARLSQNVAGASGRESFIPVRMQAGPDGLIAEPIYGESNLIFTLVRGEGVIHIPLDVTGLSAGTEVDVELLK